jgi:hypothetical protein
VCGSPHTNMTKNGPPFRREQKPPRRNIRIERLDAVPKIHPAVGFDGFVHRPHRIRVIHG